MNNCLSQLIPHTVLSPLWQVLVLGDGSPTRMFDLLAGVPSQVAVVDVVDVDAADTELPPEAAELRRPLVRRRVWLGSEPHEGSPLVPLLFAVSFWNADDYKRHMDQEQKPIGRFMATVQLETFRQLVNVWLCKADDCELSQALGYSSGDAAWGRSYFLRKNGQILTLITEIFSPRLSQYFGATAAAEKI